MAFMPLRSSFASRLSTEPVTAKAEPVAVATSPSTASPGFTSALSSRAGNEGRKMISPGGMPTPYVFSVFGQDRSGARHVLAAVGDLQLERGVLAGLAQCLLGGGHGLPAQPYGPAQFLKAFFLARARLIPESGERGGGGLRFCRALETLSSSSRLSSLVRPWGAASGLGVGGSPQVWPWGGAAGTWPR